jgi:hypothetical protein
MTRRKRPTLFARAVDVLAHRRVLLVIGYAGCACGILAADLHRPYLGTAASLIGAAVAQLQHNVRGKPKAKP